MLAVILPITELSEYLAFRYSALGRPLELTPLTFDFAVSNSHYRYTTTSGRFILKAMAHSDALYGQSDVVQRLEVVGKAVVELRHAGLPVEEIVCGNDGRYVGRYDNYLLCLYVFDPGRAFSGTAQDFSRSARSLRRLHAEGLSCLGEDVRTDLMDLRKAYPLCTTAAELPRLHLFVAGRADTSPTYATILDHWNTIEWAVDRALGHDVLVPDTVCLVHTDFHPCNALFHDGREEATMIDLDNMLIERRLICLGFAILRFAFYRRERTPDALREAIATFAAEHDNTPDFMDRLVHAMIFIEIEKVVRILQRVRTTGEYTEFLKNICPLHIANINLLRTSFVHE